MLIFRFLHLKSYPEGVWMKANLSLFIWMKANLSLFICKRVKNIMTKGKEGTTLLRSAWAVSMTAQQKKK